MQHYQNKTLFISGLITIVCVGIPFFVGAQNLGLDIVGDAGATAGYDAATNETTFATTIGTGIRVLLSFVGIIFTVLTVYSGILWMTARGNESQVEDAKKTLQNSLIGLLIAIGSYSISGFVIQAFETGSQGGGGGGGGSSEQCCMLCNRTGLSGACNFSTLESNPDVVIAGPVPVPSTGQCRDLEDNYPTCGEDGRCVSRKFTDERCNP